MLERYQTKSLTLNSQTNQSRHLLIHVSSKSLSDLRNKHASSLSNRSRINASFSRTLKSYKKYTLWKLVTRCMNSVARFSTNLIEDPKQITWLWLMHTSMSALKTLQAKPLKKDRYSNVCQLYLLTNMNREGIGQAHQWSKQTISMHWIIQPQTLE